MTFEHYDIAHFLLISTIIIGGTSLLIPFITKQDSPACNILLIAISIIFFGNIILIDFLFLRGIRGNVTVFTFDIYTFAFHMEAIGIIFLNLIGALWICALLYTIKFLHINSIKNHAGFLLFFNLAILIGACLFLAANLLTMFICYELLTLVTIPLIMHSTNTIPPAIYSYLKILLCGSMILFLPFVVLIYAKANHGDFIYHGFIKDYFSNTQTICLLIMCIFGINKTAIYPLHRWLPAAMIAPYPVSALLHAVIVVKAGLFCIFKILIYTFGIEYLHSLFEGFNWILIFPVVTVFYSAYKAYLSDDIKMLLAYSTISQLSLAMTSAMMFTEKSIAAAVLHALSHAITKISLFYAAGNYYTLYKCTKIKHLLGLSRRLPLTSMVMLIAGLSLIGVPPFAGFVSKFYIFLAASAENQILVMVTVACSSIISGLYITKVLMSLYGINTEYDSNNQIDKTLPVNIKLALIICATMIICFAIIIQFINKFLL